MGDEPCDDKFDLHPWKLSAGGIFLDDNDVCLKTDGKNLMTDVASCTHNNTVDGFKPPPRPPRSPKLNSAASQTAETAGWHFSQERVGQDFCAMSVSDADAKSQDPITKLEVGKESCSGKWSMAAFGPQDGQILQSDLSQPTSVTATHAGVH